MTVTRDTIGGVVLSLFGLYFFVQSIEYRLGTPTQMGPGMFPAVVAVAVIAIGIALAVAGRRSDGPKLTIPWRPAGAIISGLAAFAIAVKPLGLLPAVFMVTAIAALGTRDNNWRDIIYLGLGACVGIWLVFIVILNVPVPAFAKFF